MDEVNAQVAQAARTLNIPVNVVDNGELSTVIFPSIVDHEVSRLAPLAKADALHQLLRQSDLVTLDPATAPVHLDTLKRLLDQTVSYRLLAGRDLLDDPSAVEPLLRSVLQPEEV